MAWHDRVGFPVIDYDDPDYATRVRDIARTMGLTAHSPLAFRDDTLNHNTVSQPAPAMVADAWQTLQGLAK